MQVPLFLNQARPGLNARLNIDPSTGLPTSEGRYASFEFLVLVPESVANGTRQGAVLQYGHGLFGSRSEPEYGSQAPLRKFANEQGYVIVACDWVGMASIDAVFVGLMLATDFTGFALLPDRSTQGVVNALSLMRLMNAGEFAREVALNLDPDAERRFYFGNSQGGILGGVYMALSTEVTKGVLGVPGGPYSLLLPRSADFDPYAALIKPRYPNRVDRMCLISVIQLLWSRAEPAGFMEMVMRKPLLNTPPHRVILSYAKADAQVPHLGAVAMARAIGAKVFESNVQEGNETFFGLEAIPDDEVDSDSSLLIGWDYGSPAVPIFNQAPDKAYDTHEYPRKDPLSILQLTTFFNEGRILNTCEGPCERSIPDHSTLHE